MKRTSTESVYDWVGKVIHWEWVKNLKLDHMNILYMHNPESVLENETHRLLWDFEIQTDHLLLVRRPGQEIINKKKRNCRNVDFALPVDNRVKLK